MRVLATLIMAGTAVAGLLRAPPHQPQAAGAQTYGLPPQSSAPQAHGPGRTFLAPDFCKEIDTVVSVLKAYQPAQSFCSSFLSNATAPGGTPSPVITVTSTATAACTPAALSPRVLAPSPRAKQANQQQPASSGSGHAAPTGTPAFKVVPTSSKPILTHSIPAQLAKFESRVISSACRCHTPVLSASGATASPTGAMPISSPTAMVTTVVTVAPACGQTTTSGTVASTTGST